MTTSPELQPLPPPPPFDLPEAPADVPAPAAVESLLRATARRHTGLNLLAGLARWLTFAAALVALAALADSVLDFGRPVRAVNLLGLLAVLAWAARSWLLLPWRARWHSVLAALALQNQLGGRVADALLASHQLGQSPRPAHPRLVAAAHARALELLPRLRPALAAPLRPHARAFAIALLAIGLFTGAALVHPEAGLLLRRVALSSSPLPTRTQIVSINGDLALPSGKSVVLEITTTGRQPAQATLTLWLPDGPRSLDLNPAATPSADSPRRFGYQLEKPLRSLRYQFTAGDAQSPIHHIEILPVPGLRRVVFREIPPPHTGAPTTEHAPGPMTLHVGSTLTIELQADQTLASARLLTQPAASPISQPLVLDPADPTRATGGFIVPPADLTAFALRLVNPEGLTSADDTFYPLTLRPDLSPEVSLLAPADADSMTLAPRGRLPVRARLIDDHGLRSARLIAEILPPGKASPLTLVVPLPIPPGDPREALVETTLSPSQVNPPWTPGTRITWHIETTDNRTGEPAPGRSPPRQLDIITSEEKNAELTARIGELGETFETLGRDQTRVRETLPAP